MSIFAEFAREAAASERHRRWLIAGAVFELAACIAIGFCLVMLARTMGG